MLIKKKYLVDKYWEIPDTNIKFVGGKDGVFCSWKTGTTVFLAVGDDGSWTEIASYHEHWIPQIVACLARIAVNAD